MPLHIPRVLDAELLARARAVLADAPWADGRGTAGPQAAAVKHNQQLPAGSDAARALQALVLAALDRHALFFSAALPRRVLPPMVNRHADGGFYGDHVDQAIRQAAPGQRLRTDLSCTLFLSDPAGYDGGELVIVEPGGSRRFKLPAGDALLYPSTQLHRVEPVTRGERLASVFWVESLVRCEVRRRLLFDMDLALMGLRGRLGENEDTLRLTGAYHNLLRLWAET